MKVNWVVPTGIFCLACATGILIGQEKEDRTLLSHEQMTAIINEVSGERAMHYVLELVPYQFVRPPSEYQGHFRESEVMAKFAQEYGFRQYRRQGASALRGTNPAFGSFPACS